MPRKLLIRTLVGLALILVLGIGGLLRSAYIEHPVLWGETMGTSYRATLTGKVKRTDLKKVYRAIETELAEINRQMSTWDPASEIAQFNQAETTAPFAASPGFAAVVARALALSAATDGAFDPTLQPLLNLWGFGSEAAERTVPAAADIAAAKARTGWEKVAIEGDSNLLKSVPELSLNLGAIAKGYGVDAIGTLLDAHGFENWFVEIGGEVVVRGLNPKGIPWRIGIQYPSTNPMNPRLQGIVHLSGGAIATSGDYRNYIEEDGIVYSHILDPRTGDTVRSDTASVTVAAPNCMDADGIATALFVMGSETGLSWVHKQPGVEALFLVRGANEEITEKFSSGFIDATDYTQSH